MKFLDLTLPSPEENLACDEALLETCETELGEEVLRFWESKQNFAVLGYSNKVESELNKEVCQREKLPILRRISGGGTVLQGPGCLNYALFLEIAKNPELRTVTSANRFIMERHRSAVAKLLGKEVLVQGHTDLTLGGLKFSGNSQRRKKKYLLFHGTFLIKFDFTALEKYLRMPSKQPDYRKSRTHSEFLTNLKISSDKIKSVLKEAWSARGTVPSPHDRTRSVIQKLVAETYSNSEWNFKL